MQILRLLAVLTLAFFPFSAQAEEAWPLDKTKMMADSGNTEAQFELGKRYMTGNGVEKDIDRGLDLFRASASAGYPKSQHIIGKLYRDGLYLKQSENEAVEWFKKSANQGYWVAQYDLAVMYARYRSNKEAMILAYAWFDVLDKRGHPKARLGRDEIKKELDKPNLIKAKRIANSFYENYVVPFEKPKTAEDDGEDQQEDETTTNQDQDEEQAEDE